MSDTQTTGLDRNSKAFKLGSGGASPLDEGK